MMRNRLDQLHTVKAVVTIIIVNIALLLLTAYSFLRDLPHLNGLPREITSRFAISALIILISFISVYLSVRDTMDMVRLAQKQEALENVITDMETLYRQLRAQRHDFLNHMQIVYGLINTADYTEAHDYIERVYQDVRRIGSNLRTAHPAINALLSAKQLAAEEHGISWKLNIDSDWKKLPFPAWEICRVLGNLIDNAIAALSAQPAPRFLEIRLTEEPVGQALRYGFSVRNNGPAIAPELWQRIFEPGFTTGKHRADGRGEGMGLAIVAQIMKRYNGQITLHSDEESTCFSGWFDF